MTFKSASSNMGNACGCPPTMAIFHKGIITGLGTDGYTHDMLESWKVANILHKHHLCDPGAAWSEVPAMLFTHNVEIAWRYFKQRLGVIEPGASADVIIADYIPPTPMNAGNVNGHMLFGMNGRSVITTIANGRVLMKDRVLQEIDEKEAAAHIREGASRLWQSING